MQFRPLARRASPRTDEAARTGAPILRTLLFEPPDDPVTYTTDDELLLGDALVVDLAERAVATEIAVA